MSPIEELFEATQAISDSALAPCRTIRCLDCGHDRLGIVASVQPSGRHTIFGQCLDCQRRSCCTKCGIAIVTLDMAHESCPAEVGWSHDVYQTHLQALRFAAVDAC